MLKIRLARGGTKKRPYYSVVVADSHSPRDGRFIEKVGTYNPLLKKDDPNRVVLKVERIQEWMAKGAQPTDRVARELGKVGVIQWTASNNPTKGLPGTKAKERVEEKAQKEASRIAAAAEAAANPPPPPVIEEPVAKEAPAAEEVAVAEAAPAEEAPAAEAAPVEEATAEPAVAEKAPAAEAVAEEPAAEAAPVEEPTAEPAVAEEAPAAEAVAEEPAAQAAPTAEEQT